jgi:hypothetical protein
MTSHKLGSTGSVCTQKRKGKTIKGVVSLKGNCVSPTGKAGKEAIANMKSSAKIRRSRKNTIVKKPVKNKKRTTPEKIVLNSRKWKAVGWDKRTDEDLIIENNINRLLTFVSKRELVSTANALEKLLAEMEGKQYDSSSKLTANNHLQSVWNIFQRWTHPIEFDNAKCNLRLSF